jgi:acyl carrier protein
MASAEVVRKAVFTEIATLISRSPDEIIEDMRLIGGDGVLDSMKLVELCVVLEDKASELGFDFDWTSDAAMSRSRSMFRTAGSLAAEFISQLEAKR